MRCNLSHEQRNWKPVRRFGQIIRLKQGTLDAYVRLHAEAWPEVLQTIHDCNIRNYSIFLYAADTLFAYFEYTGHDFAADMARMAADPKTQEWWRLTDPMQEPVPERKEGEWWHTLAEVFHTA